MSGKTPFDADAFAADVKDWYENRGGREQLAQSHQLVEEDRRRRENAFRIRPETLDIVIDYTGPNQPRANPLLGSARSRSLRF